MRAKSNLFIFSALFCLFLNSCENNKYFYNLVDKIAFRFAGGTVFSKPSQVTMKEIHLDKGLLLGQEVMVQGEILEIGRYHTYVVMSDNTAGMLVVLTDLEVMDFFKDEHSKGERIKILGVIDYGKKGLPYILAKSVVIVKDYVTK